MRNYEFDEEGLCMKIVLFITFLNCRIFMDTYMLKTIKKKFRQSDNYAYLSVLFVNK